MPTLVKQKGSSRWYVVWRQDGRQVWRSTGTEDRGLAEEMLREVAATLQDRRLGDRVQRLLATAARTAVVESRHPLPSLWELYEAQPKPREVRERTERSKRNAVRTWVEWMQQRHPEVSALTAVTEQHAAEYMADLGRRGLAGQTRNNRLSMLHDVFRIVRVPARLDRNVWDAVPRVAAASQRHDALSLEQVQGLYRAARGFEARVPTFWPAAIALGWHTGLRFGDVCTLEWSEIQEEAGRLVLVPGKTRKSGRRQAYLLHDDYMEWIRKAGKRWGRAGYVWPEVAERYLAHDHANPRWLFDEWNCLCSKCGIETRRERTGGGRDVKAVGFHSLRHSFVTYLLDQGVDPRTVQQAVGHGSPAMTEHYSHSLAAGTEASRKMAGLGGSRRQK